MPPVTLQYQDNLPSSAPALAAGGHPPYRDPNKGAIDRVWTAMRDALPPKLNLTLPNHHLKIKSSFP